MSRWGMELNLRHLRTLGDDTGVLQHAHYAMPQRDHGYATDDNARALLFASRALVADADADSDLREELQELQATTLSFVQHAYDRPHHRFRAFMSFDRRWLDEYSEDSDGRALWALAECASVARDQFAAPAAELFREAAVRATSFGSPRAWAYALLGLDAWIRSTGGDVPLAAVHRSLAGRLLSHFQAHPQPGWPWPEPVLTYANARLPQAMIVAGETLDAHGMVECGLSVLDWLVRTQTVDGVFSPIGNRGWYPRGGVPARFDQQPIEACSMAEACADALRVTGDEAWRAPALRAVDWFEGRNVAGLSLYDAESGGCHDGVTEQGLNRNMGAESTLSWLATCLVGASLRSVVPAVAAAGDA